MSTSDKWTFHHFLGGLAVGTFVAIFVPKHKYELAAAAVICFELIEQNIFASWLKMIQPETLQNTILDIIMGASGSTIAIIAINEK